MLRWNEHVASNEATRALRPTHYTAFHNYPLERAKGFCKEKEKSEITMEVSAWVQVSLGIFLFLENLQKVP